MEHSAGWLMGPSCEASPLGGTTVSCAREEAAGGLLMAESTEKLSSFKFAGSLCPGYNIRITCRTLLLLLLLFFRAASVAHGGSQIRGQIGATTASHSHSHSNSGSEPHLQPTPQLTTMLDP